MDNRDFQFLCINTKSLWNEGVVESGNLDIDDDGIALKRERVHVYKKTYRQLGLLKDFGLDPCGIVYGLDADGIIVYFDPCTGHREPIERIKFAYPQAIAVSSSDIFVVHGESVGPTARVTAVARVNHQVRWESVIDGTHIEDIRDIVADSAKNLYVLSADTVHRFNVCGRSPDFGNEWLAFVEDLHEPVSIAVDENDAVYVLDKSEESVKKF